VTAASSDPIDLNVRDPRAGDLFLFKNATWKITERSTYQNDDGYQCVEWTCEAGSVEAYLLKETEDNHAHKWFFTLTIDEDAVTVPSSGGIVSWIKENDKAQPPQDLHYRGQSYHYADKTEGMYDNDAGERTKKTTWDYWDAGHRNNLAVEIWETGEVDCYLGYYIQAGDVRISARANALADHPYFSSDALKGVGWAAFMVFYFVIQVGGVFDQILTFAIGALLLFAWIFPVIDAPQVAALSVVTAAALGFVFWHFPPLTTAVGFLFFLGAPYALAWFLKKTSHSLSDKAARLHIAYALEIPLVFLGFAHYFKFAPAPHDFGQYCLALAPAVLGALVAWGMVSLAFSRWGPSDVKTPSIEGLIR